MNTFDAAMGATIIVTLIAWSFAGAFLALARPVAARRDLAVVIAAGWSIAALLICTGFVLVVAP